jgi:peptidoglycan/xylan/chitin deacetylase (PgdA/CDA1 family)
MDELSRPPGSTDDTEVMMQKRSNLALQAALRILAVAIAAAFVLGAAAIAVAGSDTDRSTGPYDDAKEGLPVDISSAALSQHLNRLTMRVETAGPIDSDQLRASAGAGICWTIAVGSEKAQRFCLSRAPGDWTLVDARGRAIPSHTDVGHNSIAVSAALPDLKLEAGPSKWFVTATPETCELTTGSSVTGTTGTATKPGDCADRAPDTSKPEFSARIWQLRAVGCSAKPAKQYREGPANKQIALTFDDGPSQYTPGFLKELKRLNVHATFFMIGQQVPGKRKLLKQMIDDGHELANHSWNHANLGKGGGGAASQLRDTQTAIKHASGYTPCVFRPPYGATGSDLVSRATEQGLATILWSADALDWRLPGKNVIVNRVMAQTHKGGIILEHDGGGNRSQTLAAIPQYVKRLRAKGYEFVTVSEQLGFETKYRLVR